MATVGPIPSVWDGSRPLFDRKVVKRRHAQYGQLGAIAATEILDTPTDWCFARDHHTIVVHLDGRLDHMECAFSNGPSGLAVPSPGDVWMIPAGCRYAALAQGEYAKFVEFTVPTSLLADVPLLPRVKFRDDFLAAAASRLSELMEQTDDAVGRLTAQSVAEALQMHLLERYGSRQRQVLYKRTLSTDDQARLREVLTNQPDDDHSLSSLAELVGLEVRRFTQEFQRVFGTTPWQFVIRVRLERAAKLLLTTQHTITEITFLTGFATPSHFATAFFRRFGKSPSRYRAECR